MHLHVQRQKHADRLSGTNLDRKLCPAVKKGPITCMWLLILERCLISMTLYYKLFSDIFNPYILPRVSKSITEAEIALTVAHPALQSGNPLPATIPISAVYHFYKIHLCNLKSAKGMMKLAQLFIVNKHILTKRKKKMHAVRRKFCHICIAPYVLCEEIKEYCSLSKEKSTPK